MANPDNLDTMMAELDISNEKEEELVFDIDEEETTNRFEL